MEIREFSKYNYDYSAKLDFHFKPHKGWVNDPNGLVYFKGYYHLFFQYCPNIEYPFIEGNYMHWGHARSKDFINWEEMPIALYPDSPYDNEGCWSGSAIVKDDTLYLFYASIHTPDGADRRIESVSVAYSKDGINFEKYENNPIIAHYPEDGFPDFRDPAVTCIDGKYYCVMATGTGTGPETPKVARLLIYESDDLLHFNYGGIAAEWEDSIFAECPSIMPDGDKILLCCSIVPTNWKHYFYAMHGKLENLKYTPEIKGSYDRGPDQYAGQVFKDHKGRNLHITWIPGWYVKLPRCVGTWSVPRQITVKNGKVYGYPVEEVQHLLKDSDPAVKMTEDGFIIERTDREPVVHKGKVEDIKILHDGYILEVFVNGGEDVYSVLL